MKVKEISAASEV